MEKSVMLKKSTSFSLAPYYKKIVKANFSQSSIIFNGIGIGLQCVPNSIMSLIYNKYKPCHLWKPTDLDKILETGNILYNSIGKNTTLLVSEIPRYIKLYEFIYFLKYETCALGYIFEDNITINSVKFSNLSNFFSKFKYFVLILSDSCVSIVNDNNTFWVFDPHSRNEEGFPSSSGTSILLHFKNFINFCTYIEKFSQLNNYNMYELTPIEITKLKKKTELEKEIQKNRSEVSSADNNIYNNRKNDNEIIHDENNRLKVSSANNNVFNKRKNDNGTIYDKKNKSEVSSTDSNISNKRKNDNETTYDKKIKRIKIEQKLKTDIELTKKLGYKLKQVKVVIKDILKNNTNQLKIEKKIKKCNCNQKIIQDEILCKKNGYNLPILKISIKKLYNCPKQKQIKNNIKINKKSIQNHCKNIEKSMKYKSIENYGKNIENSIKIFHTLTTEGPIYVCSICQQINFLHNLSQITKLKKNSKLLEECNTHYKSINNIEYICNTCKKYIYKNKVPKLSIKNGCGFNKKPDILDLFCLEERFISPVMAFMLIHQLFPGGQFSLQGGICHLPIEIGKIVNILPRTYSQFETIAVKLKRRLCYKNSVFSENIRPHKIIEALKYLINTSDLYKDHNINIDYEWLKLFNNNNTNNIEKNNPNNQKINLEELNSSSDEDSETEETPNAPSINTLLTEKTKDPNSNILCIAPGEGQKPIFTDEDTEYLCFPTIFCGKRRNKNEYDKVTKREIFKYELRSHDKRVSTNIPNIFWKTKYKQIQQIHQQVNFALRRNQTKDQKITAKTLLNKESRDNIVKLDDGYQIFKNIRSSPPYFENKKKNLMAMIRQLGIPTLFISLSAADTKWTNLLSSIKTLLTNQLCKNEEIEQMSWSEKCTLISSHPTICSLYFDNRVKKFYKHILKSPHSPFGKLVNFFYRVEFQHRGSPHIHSLLWIENAPHYENNSDEEIIKYIDSIISCEKKKIMMKTKQLNYNYINIPNHVLKKLTILKNVDLEHHGHQ